MAETPARNTGISALRNGGVRPRERGKRTIVVTGIARSGTSLVASVLKAAGLHMGDLLHDVVNEDAQMLEIVRSRDVALLRALVQQRNAKHSSWGFKVPNLHAFMRHDELKLFRNPHLIVIYRDPVAVALRDALSEYTEHMDGVISAAGAMHAMAWFAKQAECPLLLLSYEKAIADPVLLIDSLLDFCGISLSVAKRSALLEQVKPNNPDYFAVAGRRFLGSIDGYAENTVLGWCVEDNRLEPVRLELFADDRLLETFFANLYRADLALGGVGNGCHAFAIDLSPHNVPASATIRVKIAGRLLELENSGQRLDQLERPTSA